MKLKLLKVGNLGQLKDDQFLLEKIESLIFAMDDFKTKNGTLTVNVGG